MFSLNSFHTSRGLHKTWIRRTHKITTLSILITYWRAGPNKSIKGCYTFTCLRVPWKEAERKSFYIRFYLYVCMPSLQSLSIWSHTKRLIIILGSDTSTSSSWNISRRQDGTWHAAACRGAAPMFRLVHYQQILNFFPQNIKWYGSRLFVLVYQ